MVTALYSNCVNCPIIKKRVSQQVRWPMTVTPVACLQGCLPEAPLSLTATRANSDGPVWTAPAVQEESDYQRSVRVRSCIRPLSAAVWPLALM